ncbi:hypothetical protein CEW83_19430 [Parazoarcus communis]|uniref:Thioredoxin-like fold domain-containing protein n=1 Tax=Parazoarcus communis TaxID=41977 RepID=A0A2U8GVT0_9RHOO|nr:thioredoxin fold domain-containing protein [Parazoarcus communis]AWI77136.1 hypothetical protein CEW83_19430 [Parazoarcus communis]
MTLSAAQGLPAAENLAQDARRMRAEALPMVVLYSQAGCTWCEEARRYLVPMSSAAETRDHALYRQVDIDSDAALVDFEGTRTTHREFARVRKVRLTPTVVVYGPDGARIGEAIVGMRLPDFYGQYLSNAVDAARTTLNSRTR